MSNDNHPGNGLLLRADIHTLFDLDLIGIDPEELIVNVNPLLADSDYASFVGLRISTEKGKPSAAALKERWGMFIQRSQSVACSRQSDNTFS